MLKTLLSFPQGEETLVCYNPKAAYCEIEGKSHYLENLIHEYLEKLRKTNKKFPKTENRFGCQLLFSICFINFKLKIYIALKNASKVQNQNICSDFE